MGTILDLLPELVIHHIISCWRPNNEEAIQSSLVSKQFSNILHNRAALAFVPRDDQTNWRLSERNKKELGYIISTLKRYRDENIHLDTFKFHITGKLIYSDHRDFDTCIELAAGKRLTNLDLKIPGVLPGAVFGVKSLVHLSLSWCRLPPPESLTVCLPNLRELYLDSVYMSNEGVLENMIKGCPLIETLGILCCYMDNAGFNFKVSNLPNLKKLDIFSLGEDDQTVEVHAPSLEYMKCFSYYRCPIDLGKHEYPNLKTLDLRKAQIVDGNFFINFGCKFPVLEYLSVGPILGTARISLWSLSLKEIRLFVKRKPLEEACFDVPNIVRFEYTQKCLCQVLPNLSFTRGECIAQIELEECTDDIQGSWFLNQKQFFTQLNMPFEASIDVIFPEEVFLNEAHWLNSPDCAFPPAGIITMIREFSIRMPFWRQQFSLSFARAVLDAIFQIYRPQTITFYYVRNPVPADRPCYEYNVKNATISSTSDEILELLKPHEKDQWFSADFHLA